MTKNKIVLVPFPFDDLNITKVRPAICLTEPIGPYRHVVVAFISSQIPAARLYSDLVLEMDDPEFHATGLRVSSVIRLHRLMTISSSLIQREIGEASPITQHQISLKLRELFGLSGSR